MYIHEINTPLAVHTPHGSGQALFIFDYSINVNSMFLVRLDETGKIKHYYSEDILIYPNPANGEPKLIIPENWKQ